MPISTLDKDKVAAFGDKECAHDEQPIGVRARRRQRVAARAHNGLKPMRFVSLHHHSTFSFLDGYGLPEVHIRRATEINMSTIAFTEHGNVSSHVKAEKAGEEQGIKVIFGCEVYTGRVGEHATQRKYHLTLLAATPEGYRNLLHLVSAAYAEGFYYEPTVSWEMLKRYREGIIILSGCQGSLLFCSLMGGKLIEKGDASYARAKEVARRFQRAFGDAYYIEVQAFPQLAEHVAANPYLAQIGRELGISIVATKDCHYTVPEEAEIQKVLHNVRPGSKQTLEDQVRSWGYKAPLSPPPTDMAIYRHLLATGLSREESLEAIVTTEEIAQRCDVTLPKLPMLRFPIPDGHNDSISYWRSLLNAGWRFRGCDKMPKAEQKRYKDKLKYEMSIIEEKDYVDYFLVVADAVVFAKESGIPVGPARGSAAASLACWMLRVTEVNPMLFPNLVFERFIDLGRADLPDIDLDFDSDRRHEVREYLVSKYGQECVNNVGTFTYYKSKLALDDVAKVHKVPPYEVDKIKELLIERSSGDLRASATIEDTVEQFEAAGEVVKKYPELRKAMALEGNTKQGGVHSAGLVVSNGDIRDVAAVYQRVVNGRTLQVVSMDKYDAERQRLLKLDFLGLTTMAMIAEALRQLNMTVEDLYAIRLDDEKTLQGFIENDVVGIFQFEGRAMRSVNGALKADSFKEVCDVNALARPGPLHNGAANEYIDIKRGVKRPEKMHPALDEITADTHYQIVYQEQVLRIVTWIGNFDWTHASYIRRIISRKLGEQEFQRQWTRFREGARTFHKRNPNYPAIDDATAKRMWGLCITSGSYAFNYAHCCAYGMLGFWTMHLKRRHPEVFYAASLSKMPKGQSSAKGGGQDGVSDDRHSFLLRDAARKGIEVLPPGPRSSGVQWKAVSGARQLRAGFANVHGMGEAKAQAIVEHRDQFGLTSWDGLSAIRGFGDKTIEKIKTFCATPDPFRVRYIDDMLERVRGDLEELGIPEPTHRAADVPYERGQDTEITWMGMGLQRNLRDIYESNRARTGIELKSEDVKDPHLNEWVMILGTDGDEQVTLRINRWKYPRFRNAVWGLKLGQDVIVARGVKPGWRTAREIYVSELWILDPNE